MRKLPLCSILLMFCSSCSPAEWQAAKSELEWFRELAGDVCVRGESWEACVEKCEHTKDPKSAPSSAPSSTPAP